MVWGCGCGYESEIDRCEWRGKLDVDQYGAGNWRSCAEIGRELHDFGTKRAGEQERRMDFIM